MIYREILPDGTILVRGALRVEVHAKDGGILSGHDITPEELAAHQAWEAQQTGDTPERLTAAPRHAVEPGTYRDAVSGQYVTPEYAAEHPDTTVSEDDSAAQENERLRAEVERLTAENAEMRAELAAALAKGSDA